VHEAGYPHISIAKPSKCKNQYYVHVFIFESAKDFINREKIVRS
jgi:hypothetical protein